MNASANKSPTANIFGTSTKENRGNYSARTFAHFIFAQLFGYCWLPCLGCGRWFGGHQVARIIRRNVFTAAWHERCGIGLLLCPRCCQSGQDRDPVLPVRSITLDFGQDWAVENGALIYHDEAVTGVPAKRDSFWLKMDLVGTFAILCASYAAIHHDSPPLRIFIAGLWLLKPLQYRFLAMYRSVIWVQMAMHALALYMVYFNLALIWSK